MKTLKERIISFYEEMREAGTISAQYIIWYFKSEEKATREILKRLCEDNILEHRCGWYCDEENLKNYQYYYRILKK